MSYNSARHFEGAETHSDLFSNLLATTAVWLQQSQDSRFPTHSLQSSATAGFRGLFTASSKHA